MGKKLGNSDVAVSKQCCRLQARVATRLLGADCNMPDAKAPAVMACIYDNMKTAVDKVGRGKERLVNKWFQAMVSHYLFEADFCNPAVDWEKGQVEKGVRDARHRLGRMLHQESTVRIWPEMNISGSPRWPLPNQETLK